MEERKSRIYRKISNQCRKKGLKPEFLSFSKMELYYKCPLAYKIKYKSDLKIPYKSNVYADIGDLCHSLLEKYIKYSWNKEKIVSEFTIASSIIVNKYGLDMNIPLIISLLHFFNNSNFMENLKNYELEFEKPIYFKVKEDTEKEYWYVGFIDLLIKDNEGNTHIIDFKTSSISSYSGEKLKFNILQLMCYAYIYEVQYEQRVDDVGYLFLKFCDINYLNFDDKNRKKSKLERVHINKEMQKKDGKIETLEVNDTLVIKKLNKEVKTENMKEFLSKLFNTLNAKEYDASKRNTHYCGNFCPFRNSEYCNYKDKEDETIESSAQQLSDFLLSQIGEENE